MWYPLKFKVLFFEITYRIHKKSEKDSLVIICILIPIVTYLHCVVSKCYLEF